MNLHIDNDTCHEIIFTQGGVSHSLDKLYYNEHLVWQKLTPDPYATQYFTIESLEDNNSITLGAFGTPPSITLYYSTDDGTTWSSHTSSSSKQWGLNTGEKILFKATASKYSDGTSYWYLTGTKTHNVYGNIMSLLYGDNFTGQTSFPTNSNYAFYSFFNGDSYLLNTNNLVLPATTLVSNCYERMFHECTSLTTVPKLPATTLANYCYQSMFRGCTSLTVAPVLSATTLASNCYSNMFNGCTSLTKAPELPATTLAYGCYAYMFYNCTSLTTAPTLPALTLANYCYDFMFWGCTSLTTAPALPATTLAEYCYKSMFRGCTSLTEAPELHATTLTYSCYNSMFRGCTSLKKVVCLATDISAIDCLKDWLYNVSATGDFYKAASMTSWTTGVSGIPSGWTVNNYS